MSTITTLHRLVSVTPPPLPPPLVNCLKHWWLGSSSRVQETKKSIYCNAHVKPFFIRREWGPYCFAQLRLQKSNIPFQFDRGRRAVGPQVTKLSQSYSVDVGRAFLIKYITVHTSGIERFSTNQAEKVVHIYNSVVIENEH